MKSGTEISSIVKQEEDKYFVVRTEHIQTKKYKLIVKTKDNSLADVFLDENEEYIGKFENPLNHKRGGCYRIYNQNNNLIGFHCIESVCASRSEKSCCNPNSNYVKALDLLIDSYEKNKQKTKK
jgi:hypothetical protein